MVNELGEYQQSRELETVNLKNAAALIQDMNSWANHSVQIVDGVVEVVAEVTESLIRDLTATLVSLDTSFSGSDREESMQMIVRLVENTTQMRTHVWRPDENNPVMMIFPDKVSKEVHEVASTSEANFNNKTPREQWQKVPFPVPIIHFHIDTVGHEGLLGGKQAYVDKKTGIIHGRGTADMKGSAAAALLAMKILNQLGLEDFAILITSDEESQGGRGGREVTGIIDGPVIDTEPVPGYGGAFFRSIAGGTMFSFDRGKSDPIEVRKQAQEDLAEMELDRTFACVGSSYFLSLQEGLAEEKLAELERRLNLSIGITLETEISRFPLRPFNSRVSPLLMAAVGHALDMHFPLEKYKGELPITSPSRAKPLFQGAPEVQISDGFATAFTFGNLTREDYLNVGPMDAAGGRHSPKEGAYLRHLRYLSVTLAQTIINLQQLIRPRQGAVLL